MVSTRRILRLATKPIQRARPTLQPTLPSADTISGSQITARASYYEASEMQKRGQVNTTACDRCAQGNGRWTQCVSVAGELRGACANCHWQSMSNSCSLKSTQLRSERKGDDDEDDDDDDEPPPSTPKKKAKASKPSSAAAAAAAK